MMREIHQDFLEPSLTMRECVIRTLQSKLDPKKYDAFVKSGEDFPKYDEDDHDEFEQPDSKISPKSQIVKLEPCLM